MSIVGDQLRNAAAACLHTAPLLRVSEVPSGGSWSSVTVVVCRVERGSRLSAWQKARPGSSTSRSQISLRADVNCITREDVVKGAECKVRTSCQLGGFLY